jgi:hypothetical protein
MPKSEQEKYFERLNREAEQNHKDSVQSKKERERSSHKSFAEEHGGWNGNTYDD